MERLAAIRHAAILLAFTSHTATAVAQTDDPVWPMANGSHDILHSFQNPFGFALYFHEGLDIRGNRDRVVAVRSGTVRYVNQGNVGGTLVVEVQTERGVEADSYLHVILGPWRYGDSIEAGDVVGIVSDQYFFSAVQHHVHVNRFRDYFGGTGYIFGLTNMLHPLALFGRDENRDPQVLPALPQDANEDGWVFGVTRAGDNRKQIQYAFGPVDLMVEATDRQTSTYYFNQGILGIGYWIEPRARGDRVAGPEAPYRLMRFDDEWRASHYYPDVLVPSMLLTRKTVAFGNTNTGWTMLATYIVTNTSGTDGLASGVDSAEFWRTDARVGTGSQANGRDALSARVNGEARFPDGRYIVHALTEDLRQENERLFNVHIDNFRPYVEAVRVQRHDLGRVLYDARWNFDAARRLLRYENQTHPIARPNGTADDGILIEIEFSEAMSAAAIVAIEPSIGFLPTLQPASDDKYRWSGRIPREELGAVRDQTLYRLEISGADLAGTTLFPLADTSDRAVPFGKRKGTAPIQAATRDTVHLVPLRERPRIGARVQGPRSAD